MPQPTRDLVFISYRHKDKRWYDDLHKHLKPYLRDGSITSWSDQDIRPGSQWLEAITSALGRAKVTVLLVTPNFLASDFIYEHELTPMLKNAEEGGVRILWVPVRSSAYKKTAQKKYKAVLDPGRPLANMKAERDQAWLSVCEEIERAVIAESRPSSGRAPGGVNCLVPAVSIARLPRTGDLLEGRTRALSKLNKALKDSETNVVVCVAAGGVGKSSLINRWLAALAPLQYAGITKVYGWSFYTQGIKDSVASADEFLDAALRWFGDPEPEAGTAWDRAQRLARMVQQNKNILVLDGLEPMQHPPGSMDGKIKDPALAAFLCELAAMNSGLCVITSRHKVTDIDNWLGSTVKQMDLEDLSPEAGATLLRKLGVAGSQEELRQASQDFGGHALALTLLGRYLKKVWDGNVHCRNRVALLTDLVEEDSESGGHAKRVILSYERWFGCDSAEVELLYIIALFDRPVKLSWLTPLRLQSAISGLTSNLSKLSHSKLTRLFSRLQQTGLMSEQLVHDERIIDVHPLVREYFSRALHEKRPDEWSTAHSRLFHYFSGASFAKQPETLRDMEPLFQAISHGCKASLYSEALQRVYIDRIMRGNTFFAAHKLAAFGSLLAAISNFFEDGDWGQPVAIGLSIAQQLFVLNQAAVFLINIRGYGAPEVALAYRRVSQLSSQAALEDTTQAFQAIRGMCLYHIARGDYRLAEACAQELTALAERNASDSRLRVEAYFTTGIPLLYLGETRRSLEEMQRGAAMYDPTVHHQNAFLFGHDPGIACRCFAGWAFGLLGFPDSAARWVKEARDLACALEDSFGSVFALYCSVIVHRLRKEDVRVASMSLKT